MPVVMEDVEDKNVALKEVDVGDAELSFSEIDSLEMVNYPTNSVAPVYHVLAQGLLQAMEQYGKNVF